MTMTEPPHGHRRRVQRHRGIGAHAVEDQREAAAAAPRAQDAALSLRLAEASVSRSPGRHAPSSSVAGVSSPPVETPAYQWSSGASTSVTFVPLSDSSTVAAARARRLGVHPGSRARGLAENGPVGSLPAPARGSVLEDELAAVDRRSPARIRQPSVLQPVALDRQSDGGGRSRKRTVKGRVPHAHIPSRCSTPRIVPRHGDPARTGALPPRRPWAP